MTLAACTSKETRAVLDDVASYISERSDSAWKVLESIDPDDVNGRKANAQYALLLSMALDKNAIDEPDDSLITIATDWYRRHGTPDDRLKAFYYHGRVRQNVGDNEGAMEHFVRAESYAATAKDDYAKGLLYNAMGDVYMDVLNSDKAYAAYIQAKESYKKAGSVDNYAFSLLHIARYAIVMHYFDEANVVLGEVRSLWDKMSLYYRGAYYFQSINLKIALQDSVGLEYVVQDYLKEVDQSLVEWLKVAEAYADLKDYSSALASLNKYRDSYSGYNSDPVYCICAYEIYYSMGMLNEALEAYKSYTKIVNDTTLGIIAQDTAFVKERYESELMLQRKRITILAVILGALLVCCVLISVIWGIRWRLKEKEEENQRYLEECAFLESERDSLSELIQGNSLVDKAAQEVINSRLDLLNRFFTSAILRDDTKNKTVSEEFDSLVDNKEKFLCDTMMVFTGVHPEFITFLKEKGLTDSQLEICCLYALGLKGKDIVSYTSRKRQYIDNMDIRSKLVLTEHDRNLDKYILELLSKTK